MPGIPAVTPGCTLATLDGIRHLVAKVAGAQLDIQHGPDKTRVILACKTAWVTWHNTRFKPPGDAPTCLWCAARSWRE